MTRGGRKQLEDLEQLKAAGDAASEQLQWVREIENINKREAYDASIRKKKGKGSYIEFIIDGLWYPSAKKPLDEAIKTLYGPRFSVEIKVLDDFWDSRSLCHIRYSLPNTSPKMIQAAAKALRKIFPNIRVIRAEYKYTEY